MRAARELRYYAYGGTCAGTGTTPTDRRYTGQREQDYIKLIQMGHDGTTLILMGLAMTPYLLWDRDERANFESLNELEGLIDELSAKALKENVPLGVQVCVNSTSGLLVTVGKEESHMEFYSETDRPRGVGSHGPWDDDTLIEGNFMGERSEMARRYWVPIADAREALRRYFLTGARPDNINWE